jgi:carboxyl-terminal processing protease
VFPLGSGRELKLTTARYYTPSGRSMQARGIEPDIVVEEELPAELRDKDRQAKVGSEAELRGHLKGETKKVGSNLEESSGSFAYVPNDKSQDTQLNFALELLRRETPIENGGRGKV